MWFTENAWQPMLLFILISMGAAMGYYHRLQKRYLIVAAVCVLAAGLTWAIEAAVTTPKEELIDSVHGMVQAFRDDEFERTINYISPQAEDLRQLVGFAHNNLELGDDTRVTDVEVRFANQESRGIVKFRVNATVRQPQANVGRHQATYWETTWQREANVWRMIDVTQLDPITGEVIGNATEASRLLRRLMNF